MVQSSSNKDDDALHRKYCFETKTVGNSCTKISQETEHSIEKLLIKIQMQQ